MWLTFSCEVCLVPSVQRIYIFDNSLSAVDFLFGGRLKYLRFTLDSLSLYFSSLQILRIEIADCDIDTHTGCRDSDKVHVRSAELVRLLHRKGGGGRRAIWKRAVCRCCV